MRTDKKPADAWWDEKEKEWVHGARDDEGRLVGEIRYWDTNDILISTADHVAGKPHGIARRYYPNGEVWQEVRYVDGEMDGVREHRKPTGDVALPPELRGTGADVLAYECIYEHGDLIGTTYRHRDGREVDQNGRPIPQRPPGVEPTASPMQGGWIFMRRRGDGTDRIKISREYYKSGQLKEQSLDDGSERSYYKNGQLAVEGFRNRGIRRFQIGEWREYDARGNLRRVSTYERGDEVRRVWHRPAREANGGGTTREGRIENSAEVGTWIVRDGDTVVEEVELGGLTSHDALIAHAVTADMLDDAISDDDRSHISMIARARRAAHDISLLGLPSTPPWRAVDDDTGKLKPLVETTYGGRLLAILHAMRWSPPDGDLLAQLAAVLFASDRAQAALDVIDAALLLGSEPTWHTARAAYLRSLGREARLPGGLDDRALELLDEIRRSPDDDAPRLVFADHIASRFPEHTAVIVGQCAGKPDRELVRRFKATLPEHLRDAGTIVRGFFDAIRYMEAGQFVTGDPDLLYRIAPSSDIIELQYASEHIAQLVTMPSLRRYHEIHFNDTYLGRTQTEQLARCSHLEQLDHWGLYNTNLDDEDLEPLFKSTAFPNLTGLDLGNSRDEQNYTLTGLQPLVDAVFAPKLQLLNVSRRWMGNELLDLIVKLPALIDLDISANDISSLDALAGSQLRTLHLEQNEITDARGFRLLPELRSLELRMNPIRDEGVAQLAQLAKLERLSVESVYQAPIGPDAARALAQGPASRTLQMLHLGRTGIGAEGVEALAAAEFPALTMLTLSHTPIGNAGARALAGARFLPRLRWLYLDYCEISDAGFRALCDAETHPELHLSLGRISVDSGTKARLTERFGGRVHWAG